MKPLVSQKLIRKAKYKYSWYKDFVKVLKNQRQKNYRCERMIHMS